ncbi:MAG TPA: glutamyl-tRNA reductase [Longimicrobiales bacterium]
MLKVVGLSHHSAPVEVRERLVFDAEDGARALHAIAGDATEAVLLSTCNRTELYLALPDSAGADAAIAALAQQAGAPLEQVKPHLYSLEERRCVEHLFRVVSSLDSMILGEPQIQGQVKTAYERAVAAGNDDARVVGPILSRLFQHALAVGGKVRSETTLGAGAASIPSAAVELARKIFGPLKGLEAVVIGAGEMSELSLECLIGEGARGTVVASRTEERARAVAKRVGSKFARFEEFPALLRRADIVVSATAAPHAIITRELVQRALPDGPDHPVLMVDIALPRDIEPEVGEVPNLFVYDIDNLRQIVDANLERRQKEIPKAERIVQQGVDEFWGWHAARDVVPLIRELRGRAEALRATELERAMRRLRHLAPEDQAAVEALTRQLLNKVLHSPTARLREAAAAGDALDVADAARYLFELDGEVKANGSSQGGEEAAS